MLNNMNEKDKKTIKTGAIAAAAIIILIGTMQGYSKWNAKKDEDKKLTSNIRTLDIPDSAYNKLRSDVPVFQFPQDEQTQKENFRTELEEEFKSVRIETKPWEEVLTKQTTSGTYGKLYLKTNGTCRFQQILDLLAVLKENPYLVGVEELHIDCDPQNPQQATFNIKVSTFTTNKKGK
jgi:hypothetical protein